MALVLVCCREHLPSQMFLFEIVHHRVVVDGVVGWMVDKLVGLLPDQVLLVEPVAL